MRDCDSILNLGFKISSLRLQRGLLNAGLRQTGNGIEDQTEIKVAKRPAKCGIATLYEFFSFLLLYDGCKEAC